MEHKHTPGPWLAQDGDHFEADCVIITQARLEESKGPIAQLDTDFNEPVGEEQRANARLIAAAPELLGALQAVAATEMFLPDHPRRQAAYQAARAAIATATGTTPHKP